MIGFMTISINQFYYIDVARSNILRLDWRNRFTGGQTTCRLCGIEEETLEHFITKCRELENIRNRYG